MQASSALTGLLAAYQAVGLNPASAPKTPEAAPAAAIQIQAVFARYSLDDVQERQREAWFFPRGGQSSIGLTVGFDSQGDPWIKVSQNGTVAAARLPIPGTSTDLIFPAGVLRVTYQLDDTVKVSSAFNPADAGISIPYSILLSRLYGFCARVNFPFVTYAILYEDGSEGVPASLNLMRQAEGGDYSLGSHNLNELQSDQFVLDVNYGGKDTRYGVRLDGNDVVFDSKSVPSAAPRTSAPRRRP